MIRYCKTPLLSVLQASKVEVVLSVAAGHKRVTMRIWQSGRGSGGTVDATDWLVEVECDLNCDDKHRY